MKESSIKTKIQALIITGIALILILSVSLSIAESGTWTCPNCGTVNTGNFCSQCGHKHDSWTCPECGQINDGNFCTNCGNARSINPEEIIGVWKGDMMGDTCCFRFDRYGQIEQVSSLAGNALGIMKYEIDGRTIKVYRESEGQEAAIALDYDGETLTYSSLINLVKSSDEEFPFQYTVEGHSMDDSFGDGTVLSGVTCASTDLNLFDVAILSYPGRGGVLSLKRITGMPGDTVSFSNGYLYINGEKQEETYINDEYRSGFKNSMDEFKVPKKGDILRIKEDGYLYVGDEPWPWSNGSVSGVSSDGERLTFHQGSLLLNGKEITRSGGQYMIGDEVVDHNPIEDIIGKDYLLESDMYFVCGDHRNNSNDSRSIGPIPESLIYGKVTDK